MTINITLFIELASYIAILILAFEYGKQHKKDLNKRYLAVKPHLRRLLKLLFLATTYIFYKTSFKSKIFIYILCIHLAAGIYFFSHLPYKTRCWEQHRTLLYNFTLIPLIYMSSLIVQTPFQIISLILIYIYTYKEFQYALFSLQKPKIWN